jgi:hypothetical protein
MFKSEQSKRLPQFGQVILQLRSVISVPQRSQVKMRFLGTACGSSSNRVSGCIVLGVFIRFYPPAFVRELPVLPQAAG